MKLYMKQKVFSWGDKFRIYDENGEDVYYVEGKVFSVGKKLFLYSLQGEELAYIHQKVLSFLPRYFVSRGGEDVMEVVKKFSLLPKYEVKGPGWTAHGNFTSHQYDIMAGETAVAHISKKWFSWGDTYEIDIADTADNIGVLSVVLIIDAVMAQEASANSDND